MEKPKNSEELVKHEHCTGCMACVNICPVGALQRGQDIDGFYRPILNLEQCVNCNKCVEKCPVHNQNSNEQRRPDCFAFMAKDKIRNRSSSGGAFPVLAEYFLRNGGQVVGAVWMPDFSVDLVLIDSLKDLVKLQRSKYIQSNVANIYKEVISEADKGKEILFTGLPCQCAGLRALLNKNYENLYIVDILCAQGPSPKAFKKYLSESFDMKKVIKYDFRVKDRGWDANISKIQYSDGTTEILTPWQKSNDLWQKLYHSKKLMPIHCENCSFGGVSRQGDLTIGDFWGISDNCEELNDKKGTSLVFSNSVKGKKLIDILNKDGNLQKTPIEWAHKNRIHGYVKAAPERDRIFRNLRSVKSSIKHISENVLNDRRDIGIVTLWGDYNYGGSITAYALYNAVCDLGYDPIMIERPLPHLKNMSHEVFRKFEYPVGATTGFYSSIWQMKQDLNSMCDRFLVGSDQLFVYGLYKAFKKYQQLDWVLDYKKKAGYATSFGRDFWNGPDSERARLAFYLKKFDYFTTREISGVQLGKDLFGIQPEFALDPVFIVDKKHLYKLASLGVPFSPKDGIASYILDKNEWDKISIVKMASKKLKLKYEVVHDRWDKVDGNKSVFSEDWLAGLLNSKLIISDSFHCISFAILFNKPFIALANSWRGLTRFTSLLEMIGLSDRFIYNEDDFNKLIPKVYDIDWYKVNSKLKNEIKKSKEHLQNVCAPLKGSKSMTDFDIFNEKNEQLWGTVNNLVKKIEELEKKFS